MTEAVLLALALAPTLQIPSRARVSWEKTCDYCPRRIYEDCRALNLAGLPIRCQWKSAEEVGMLRQAMERGNDEAQDAHSGICISGMG